MRSFQEKLGEFEQRGIRVAAISTDPPETSRKHRQKLGLTYTFLADTKSEMLKRYDLLHKGAGPKGADIAVPAEMLIDPGGTIRWLNLSKNATVRARPENVLRAWEAISAGSYP